MAQDFAAAFKVGEDDKHITTVDADGVALAAIQGLYAMLKDKDAEVANLKEQLRLQQVRLEALERATRAGDRVAAMNPASAVERAKPSHGGLSRF